MKEYIKKAGVLIEALPYIQNFRNTIVVVKFGGSVMENRTLTEQALRDIVFMECIGMKPVIVHGGGKAITSRLKEENIPTRFINGLRFTCDKAIKIVDNVLHNHINANLVNTLNKLGGNAEKLSGKEILKAEKITTIDKVTGEKLDLGCVGNIFDVDIDKILALTETDTIPVITPLAIDSNSQILNVNADIAAAVTAEHLKARKLVFISDVPGILKNPNDESSVISSIELNEIKKYIAKDIISGGMIPKVQSAIQALNAGTNKVHFIDGRLQHSLLLEIFTDSGIKIALLMGEPRLYHLLRQYGFGQKTNIPFQPEATGILRKVKNWDKLSITRFPIGQGILVSPLQLLGAYTALANKGERMKLRIVDKIVNSGTEETYEFPVKSEGMVIENKGSVQEIVDMMKLVTKRGGTALRAGVPGYDVAGKTGTSQKWIDGEYSHSKYFASFIGFVPADDPAFILLIVLDEPKDKYYGGTVAGPAFREISLKTLRFLDIPETNTTEK